MQRRQSLLLWRTNRDNSFRFICPAVRSKIERFEPSDKCLRLDPSKRSAGSHAEMPGMFRRLYRRGNRSWDILFGCFSTSDSVDRPLRGDIVRNALWANDVPP